MSRHCEYVPVTATTTWRLPVTSEEHTKRLERRTNRKAIALRAHNIPLTAYETSLEFVVISTQAA